MEYVTVVVIKDSVIDEVFLFAGTHGEIFLQAEAKFVELCAECVSNWAEYSADDIESTLEDGYCTFGTGNSVCISWPSVVVEDQSQSQSTGLRGDPQ